MSCASYVDFSQLKDHFHTILQLMPDDYEQSVGILQTHFSDEEICDILFSDNCRIAKSKILNCLIKRLTCKEDLLDLCSQLEKIANSHDLIEILKKIKAGNITMCVRMYVQCMCACTYVYCTWGIFYDDLFLQIGC